ncbi:MAG: cell division protein ZapA [Desulfotomaculaceae bacterium]|nr:cell division protein ZapA [Desulfotomaculaceae bacterium]
MEQEFRVDIEIFGVLYTLKGNRTPEQMLALAQHVDNTMKRLANYNPKLSTSYLAVLAALNLADELHMLRKEYDDLVQLLEPEKDDTRLNS